MKREEKPNYKNKWVPSFSIGFDRIEATNPVGSKNILKQQEKPRYQFAVNEVSLN